MSNSTTPQSEPQYSLSKILGIWAAAAIPMGIHGWVIGPSLQPYTDLSPGFIRVMALTVGLIWLFVLSMIIIYLEEGNLLWSTVCTRLKLNKPKELKTGVPRARLWLWLIPFAILDIAWELAVSPVIIRLWNSFIPFLAEPAKYNLGGFLSSSGSKASFVGACWVLGLFFIFGVFNIVLGEEYFFRGVLLPKMNGVFGKWDLVMNGLLFGLYHVHQPWSIMPSIVTGIFLYAYPTKRYLSTWMGIIIHSLESLYFLFLIFGLVLGLA
jgi:uncharacterized protein